MVGNGGVGSQTFGMNLWCRAEAIMRVLHIFRWRSWSSFCCSVPSRQSLAAQKHDGVRLQAWAKDKISFTHRLLEPRESMESFWDMSSIFPAEIFNLLNPSQALRCYPTPFSGRWKVGNSRLMLGASSHVRP